MRFIRNMKISTNILIIAALPMLLAALFAGTLIYEQVRTVSDMERLSSLTELSIKMNTLGHEQQKERGATGVFVGSGGAQFRSEMAAQRGDTDRRLSELKSYLSGFDPKGFDATFNQKYDTWLAMLDRLPTIRDAVDKLAISKDDAVGYYTKLNASGLDVVSYMASLSTDPVIVTRLVAYANFLQGKERSGIERAIGAAGFSSGQFAPEPFDQFKSVISAQQTYGEIFLSYATQTQQGLYHQVMQSPAAMEVEKMRKIAFETGGGTLGVMAVNGANWFNAATDKINGLKGVEDTLAKDLQQTMQERMMAANEELKQVIATSAAALLAIAVLCFFVVRMINRSFSGMVNAMSRLAEGDTDVVIPAVGQTNEIGQMASTVEVFKQNSIERVRLQAEQKELEVRAQQEKRETMNALADNFKERVLAVIQSVASAATELSHTAQHMTGIINQSCEKAQDAVASSTQTTANVQSVAAAAEQMSATVKEISSQIQRSNDLVAESVHMIGGADTYVQALSTATDSVKQVVQLISNIAGQINLLALNATIESARAGEAGRGFAVVAGEIKDLASQTEKSVHEIEETIDGMNKASSDIIASLGGIKNSVDHIAETSGSVAAAVEEQSVTTSEIAVNMQSAAVGTQTISHNLQEISQGAAESQTASEQVLGAAQDLSKQAETLDQVVEAFLAEVRAA